MVFIIQYNMEVPCLLHVVILRFALFSHVVLSDGLKQNFAEVSVTVADCPDLTQQPWSLAAPGRRSKQVKFATVILMLRL